MKIVYPVVTVTLEDVRFVMRDKSLRLPSATMEAIARHMSDAYHSAGLYYWDVVTDAAEVVLEENG